MSIDIKDPALTASAFASGDKVLVERGAGGSAVLRKVMLGLNLVSLTTTERNALTAAAGMTIFNSTTDLVETYNGTAWTTVLAFAGALPEDESVALVAPDGSVSLAPYAAMPEETSRFWVQDESGLFRLATPAEAAALALGGATEAGGTIGVDADDGPFVQRPPAAQAAIIIPELVGYYARPFPATSFVPRPSNGADASTLYSLESTTNKIWGGGVDFDPDADEFIQVTDFANDAYTGGALYFRVIWTHGTATTNFDVTWAFRSRCTGDTAVLDQAFGTPVTLVDTGAAGTNTYPLCISDLSGPVTPAGTTPGPLKFWRHELYRDTDGNGTAGNDDLAVPAKALMLIVYYPMDDTKDFTV